MSEACNLNSIWQMVEEKLSEELTPVAIDTWIKACEPVDLDGDRLVIRVPEQLKEVLEQLHDRAGKSGEPETVIGEDVER